ncbi:MAG: FtsX-like permease family protein [Proteobacteria bacterium]|nr:FtsX-like permease family protein [Pseudomonadota bacterium]MBU1686697.1 FtsX-like permease family protein [Pseudomonadota bacterium]
MRIVFIAWRNLLRNRRRTLITAFSVAFGVLLSVTFTASGDYTYTNMINSSATMGFGHVTIAAKGYNDTPTLTRRLVAAEELRRQVLSNHEVENAYVRIAGQAMFAAGVKSIGGQVIGVHPLQERPEHNLFIRSIIQGILPADSESTGALIGAKMAEKLNLRLGKKLIYTLTDRKGDLVSGMSRVSGIFQTGEDMVDSSVVLLPINRLRRLLGYDAGDASLISVLIWDQRGADLVRQKLIGSLQQTGYEILTWAETQADLAGLIAIDRAGNYLMQFLVGLLIAAGILNTLLMSVMERTREFGMMMALGMSPVQVVIMVMVESLMIGLLGLFLGAVITTPWYIYMAGTGIDFSSQIGQDYSTSGVLVDPVMKFRLFKESVIGILAGVFILTLLAGIFPAIKAGRVPPLASIRGI